MEISSWQLLVQCPQSLYCDSNDAYCFPGEILQIGPMSLGNTHPFSRIFFFQVSLHTLDLSYFFSLLSLVPFSGTFGNEDLGGDVLAAANVLMSLALFSGQGYAHWRIAAFASASALCTHGNHHRFIPVPPVLIPFLSVVLFQVALMPFSVLT